jgi:hypothetical protein
MKKLMTILTLLALLTVGAMRGEPATASPGPVIDGVIGQNEYCNFLHVDNGAAALPGQPYDMYWDSDATNLYVAFDRLGNPDDSSLFVHHVSILNICQMVAHPNTPVVGLNISRDCIVPQYFQFTSATQTVEFIDNDDFVCEGDPRFDNSWMMTAQVNSNAIERSYPLTLLQNPPVTNPPPGAITSIGTSDVTKITFRGGANDTRGVDGPNRSPRMTFGCPAQPFATCQCVSAAGPANDLCENATLVTLTRREQLFQQCINTTGAMDECGEAGLGSASVWYKVTVPSNGSLDLSTFGAIGVQFTNYDTTITVYNTTTCLPDPTTQIAANDNFQGDVRSRVRISVTANQTVLVRVAGVGGATGRLCVRFVFTPGR